MKMKKIIIGLVVILLIVKNTFAQSPLYAAAKAGLNMREKPESSAATITKIPYGEKVVLVEEKNFGEVITEGMDASWNKVSFGEYTGYVANVYLLPIMPPKSGQPLVDYLNSISKITATKSVENKFSDYSEKIDKTLYDNGISLRNVLGYEYDSQTIWLPNFNLYTGFVLARLLSPVSEILSTKDAFPSKPITNESRSIKIYKQYEGATRPSMVRFEFCDGICYSVEIREEESEISITFAGGV